ncbi:ribonuclease E-like [Tachysurus ichikawai]
MPVVVPVKETMVEVDLEEPAEAPVVLVAEEAPVLEEVPVTPVVEEAGDAPVVVEVPVSPAVEEPADAPVLVEVPVSPAVEEPADDPIVEEALVARAVEEAHVAPIVEEVLGAEEALSVAPAATEQVPNSLLTEIVVMSSESPVVPEATEVPVVTESSEVVAESPAEDAVSLVGGEIKDELPKTVQVVAEVTTSAEITAPPAVLEEPEHEYVVVMLEGAPKTDKKVKVLGVSPTSGRIIPAPEKEEPAEPVTGNQL